MENMIPVISHESHYGLTAETRNLNRKEPYYWGSYRSASQYCMDLDGSIDATACRIY
jgi:hypothetical protein